MTKGLYGAQISNHMGLPQQPALAVRVLQKALFAVTRVTSGRRDHGLVRPLPREDAVIVSLQLEAFGSHDLWLDGKTVRTAHSKPGSLLFLDLNQRPSTYLTDPFDSLHFYIPRAALVALAADLGARGVPSLTLPTGAVVDDETVWHLSASLLPALERPEEVNHLFVDHVAMALHTHFATTYWQFPRLAAMRGGLTPQQQRRAEELLLARLSSDVSLDELARECGLSRSHFARAFHKSFGTPPHRWLMSRRLERARELLETSAMPIAEVAAQSGFASQSHLTRVFSGTFGTSPGQFRRARG